MPISQKEFLQAKKFRSKNRFGSKNSLLNSETRFSISKLVEQFSLFRSKFSLVKRIFTTNFYSVYGGSLYFVIFLILTYFQPYTYNLKGLGEIWLNIDLSSKITKIRPRFIFSSKTEKDS